MFTSLIFNRGLTFIFRNLTYKHHFSSLCFLFRVDVTEIQIALVIIFVLSAFGGATMWDYTVNLNI